MTESVKYRAPRRTGSETNRYSTEIYHLRVAVDAYNLQPTEIHATYINDALDTLRSASTYFPFSEAVCATNFTTKE